MHLDHQASPAHSSPDDVWEGSRARGTSSKIRQFLTPKRSHNLTPPSQQDVSAPTPQRTILGKFFLCPFLLSSVFSNVRCEAF